MKLCKGPLSTFISSSLLITPLLFSTVAVAAEPETIRFSVPPWPGVTVKTQVASTLLDSLGYKTNKQEVGATITIKP